VTSEQLSGPRLSSLYYSCTAIKRGLVIPGYEGGREGGRVGWGHFWTCPWVHESHNLSANYTNGPMIMVICAYISVHMIEANSFTQWFLLFHRTWCIHFVQSRTRDSRGSVKHLENFSKCIWRAPWRNFLAFFRGYQCLFFWQIFAFKKNMMNVILTCSKDFRGEKKTLIFEVFISK
jgi:hypothetical protein